VVATGASSASSLSPWPSPFLPVGRLPRLPFRGLLKLHARYGLSDCSPTSTVDFVTRLQSGRLTLPNCSSATEPCRWLLGWVLPPLVICPSGHAVGHRRVTVSYVSCTPSSNWMCGFPAASSPTTFCRGRAPQTWEVAHPSYHLVQPTALVQELVVPALPSRPPTALVFTSEP
jgi:hypothetical protein